MPISRARFVLDNPWQFVKRVIVGFSANQGLLLSGAVAYYTLLTIVPMFALILTGLSQFQETQPLLDTLREYLLLITPNQADVLIDQISAQDNIEVLTNTEVVEVHGENRINEITYINNLTQEKTTAEAAALYIFIGAVAHTDVVEDVIYRNRTGFIPTGPDIMVDGKLPKGWKLKRDPFMLETNVPGIFAAGDVRQGAVRRVASAVGYGAIVVSQVHQYLKTV